MTNYSCIAVGINRYQFVEPLNYAEADAQEIVRLLTEEMGVSRERCLLLTDGSSIVGDRPTYPNYSNLSAWLDNLDNSGYSSTTQEDSLWFFFSGHGVHWQGEDYLLPVDSNLSDLPYRGIGATTLLHALKKQGTAKILVLLDIDRSPGLGMDNPVGERFSQLAQELDISLIQSVSPQECSYERKELGRGLFATALAEALSYHRQYLTLQNLSQYLTERLPELANHHDVPQQHPLIQLASSADQQELLLPSKVASGVSELVPVAAAVVNNTNNTNNNLPTPVRYRSGVESLEPVRQNTKIQPESTAVQPPNTKIQPETNNNSPVPNPVPTTVGKTSDRNTSKTTVKKMAKPEGESNSALPWILGAGLLFLLMILGVLIRNLGAFLGTDQPQTSANPSPNLVTASPSPVPAKNNGSPQAAPQAAPQTAPQASVTPSIAANPPAAIQPTIQPAIQPTPLANASPSSNANRQQSNQTILENARGLLQSDRVVQFSQAIKAASQIPPGEPLYDQAQADISRWSIVIMDMAHGRAKTGDWAGAIATAQAMPTVNQKIYKDGQIWINRWQQFIQQREVNLQQIQKARRLLRPNQATTYRQAIETIKSIPAGQPASELVQELNNNWTAEIWQIAQTRAKNGDFQGAIAAANLLPENTPTFTQAQPIIALWRQGKKSP
jgi:hypothetical protein